MLVLVLTGLAIDMSDIDRTIVEKRKGPYGPYILVYYVHLLL